MVRPDNKARKEILIKVITNQGWFKSTAAKIVYNLLSFRILNIWVSYDILSAYCHLFIEDTVGK